MNDDPNPLRRLIAALTGAQKYAAGPSQATPPDIMAILGMLDEGQRFAAGPTAGTPDMAGLMDLLRGADVEAEIGMPVTRGEVPDYLSPAQFKFIANFMRGGRFRPTHFAAGPGSKDFWTGMKTATTEDIVSLLRQVDKTGAKGAEATDWTASLVMRKGLGEELAKRAGAGDELAATVHKGMRLGETMTPPAEDLARLFSPGVPTVNPPTMAPRGSVEKMAGLKGKEMIAAGRLGPSAPSPSKIESVKGTGATVKNFDALLDHVRTFKTEASIELAVNNALRLPHALTKASVDDILGLHKKSQSLRFPEGIPSETDFKLLYQTYLQRAVVQRVLAGDKEIISALQSDKLRSLVGQNLHKPNIDPEWLTKLLGHLDKGIADILTRLMTSWS